MSKTKKLDQVVFVVDLRSNDIFCARFAGGDSVTAKVLQKHRARAVEVPAILCHGTLGEAKASLKKHLSQLIASVEELEFDEENFTVA